MIDRRDFLSKTALVPLCGVLPLVKQKELILPPKATFHPMAFYFLRQAIDNLDNMKHFAVTITGVCPFELGKLTRIPDSHISIDLDYIIKG